MKLFVDKALLTVLFGFIIELDVPYFSMVFSVFNSLFKSVV